MKKTIGVVLCLLLVFSLAACSNPSGAPAAETQAPDAAPQARGKYKAGTYTGTGTGMGGDVEVSVTFSEDAITDISVGSHNETPDISDPAIERIPQNIISNQSLGIDVVSGATLTSKAILEAVAACAEQAGGDVEALKAAPVAQTGTAKEMSADVVIVGGGVAGISAALEAADAGIKNVLLLEQTGSLGGSAYVSGGIIQGTGSKAHTERGLIDDSFEALFEYWNGMSEGKANPELQKKVAYMSGESIDWIEGMGVEFDSKLTYQGEAKAPRGLTAAGKVGGQGLMQPMIDKLGTTDVTVLMETKATEITQDANGTVTGVVAKDLVTGDEITVTAKAVILASGNAKEVKDMAKNAGADFRIHTDAGVGGTIFGNDGLYVNQLGNRFTNESGFYERVFKDLADTNAGNYNAYMIVDSSNLSDNQKIYHQADGSGQTWASLIENSKIEGFSYSGLDGGQTFEGTTLEEAIQAAGLPVDTTMASVQRYNELCKKGADEDFGKDPKNMLAVGTEGPFYVWRVPIYSINEPDPVGTPKADVDCRMVRADGSAIGGLYGAGVICVNEFKYQVYAGSGTYIQFGLSMGRIAADHAAQYIG
ncbi:MAG TPA: FAD-dependent oxidoreductase [Feifaniaceae bacterium]|nr:FAD-dependent oxidoreductase [Feifaniaceae bacterium]